MATQVRLGDKDRARLGCDEWLDLDLYAVSVEQLEVVCEETGIDPEDWPEAIYGRVAHADVGKPDAKRKRPRWANRAFVYLALAQTDAGFTWADAGKVAIMHLAVRSTEEEPGKEDPESSASETSDAGTTPPSDTSSN